jgi:hypothetical protein
MCVCATCNKISNAEYKRERDFVNEVETQLREKSLWGSQTQDIYYSEDRKSYKVVALTYPYAVVVPWTLMHNPMWTPPNQVTYLKGSSMEYFTLGLLPKIDFTRTQQQHFGNGLRASESAQQLLKYTL